MSSISEALRRHDQVQGGGTVSPGTVFSSASSSRSRNPVWWLWLGVVVVALMAVGLYFKPHGQVTAGRTEPRPEPPSTAPAPEEKTPVEATTTAQVPVEAAATLPPAVFPKYPSQPNRPLPRAPEEVASAEPAPVESTRPNVEVSPVPPEINPDQLKAREHYRIARDAHQAGRIDLALAHYHMALELEPDMAEAHLQLGNLYFHGRKDEAKARKSYETVLRLDPGNKIAHNNLGVLFLRAQKAELAEKEFAKALKQDPRFVDGLYNMACVLMRQNRKTEALSYLGQAAGIRPEALAWAFNDQDLEELVDDPGFQKLVEQIPGKE